MSVQAAVRDTSLRWYLFDVVFWKTTEKQLIAELQS